VNSRQQLCIKLIHCGNKNITNIEDSSNRTIFFMPMGLFPMATALKQKDCDVEIIHFDLELSREFKDIKEILDFDSLDAVGMDCHWANQAHGVLDTAALIKKIKPGAFIFLGGFTASFFAEEILKDNSAIDAVIRGDGEVPIVELCDVLKKYRLNPGNPGYENSLGKVQNLAWKRDNGQIICNEISYTADSNAMEQLDFASVSLLRNWKSYRELCRFWTDFPSINRHSMFFLEIGRGCIYNCSFCGGSSKAQKCMNNREGQVVRSMDSIINTIKQAISFGYSFFYSCFDFEGSDQWYIRLFQEITRENLKISFGYGCWRLPSTALIDAMSEGCEDVMIEISPETSSHDLRKKNKDARLFYTNREMETLLDYIGKKPNVKVQLYFGYFLPFDTRETIGNTVNYIAGLYPGYSHFAEILYLNLSTDPASMQYLSPGKYNIDIAVRSFKDYIIKMKEIYIAKSETPCWLTLTKPADFTGDEAIEIASKIDFFSKMFLYFKNSTISIFKRLNNIKIWDYLDSIELTGDTRPQHRLYMINDLLLGLCKAHQVQDKDIIALINHECQKAAFEPGKSSQIHDVNSSRTIYCESNDAMTFTADKKTGNPVLTAMEEFKRGREYWLGKLTGRCSELQLPTDFPRREKYTENIYKITFADKSVLTQISQNDNLNQFIILLTACKIMLHRYLDQNEIIVASPILSPDNRIFNEYVIFNDSVYPGMTFNELLKEVKETVIQGYKNEHISINSLEKALGFPRRLSLGRFALLLENLHHKELIDGIKEDYNTDVVYSFRHDSPTQRLEITVIYNSEIFKQTSIEKLVNRYKYVLTQVVNNPQVEISNVELLSEEEKTKILIDFNDTAADYPVDIPVQRLFEEQADRTPHQIALQFRDRQVSYRQLNVKANQAAHLLRSKNICGDKIVGIMVNKSLEMLIGLLGILKSGGAYLPIDPQYPEKRILYMLKDSGIHLLLVHEKIEVSCIFTGEVIYLNADNIDSQPTVNPLNISTPGNLAYVIYTSGSTGKPKGVLIEHRSVVSYSCSSLELMGLDSRDIRLQQSSFSFDQFVEEVYPILSTGGRLIILEKTEVQDPQQISALIAKHHVTIFSTTPALLREVNKFPMAPCLRRILVGGDVLKEEDISAIIKERPVDNFYGPTETTAAATHYHYKGGLKQEAIPIGTPKANYQAYILDKERRPIPIGIAGEIFISGHGVGRGYLNRPELTQERFIKNPFKAGPAMYATGDLGRWKEDGNIEFMGRIDTQVKIRGFRIELGEIERHLADYENIREAVVVAKDDGKGDKTLCAYIIPYESPETSKNYKKPLDITQLKEYLSGKLPPYMIPTFFVPVSKIPLTTNGKIDIKALPEPKIDAGEKYTPPRDEIERQLVEIWEKVIGIDKNCIGTEANFFDIGGHSLKAAAMVTDIENRLKVKVPVAEIFKTNPTIIGLAEYIKAKITD